MLNTRDTSRFWFALRVKSRFEKTVAGSLKSKGFEEFLPLYRAPHHWSDRVKEVEVPLFPRYLFCRFSAEERLRVLTTPGVELVVGIGKIPAPILDAEIAAVQAIVRSRLGAQPWPFLQVGQRVLIRAGPLAGLEWILLQTRNSYRLIVSVTLLQRSVAVEIHQLNVTPISSWQQQTLSPAVRAGANIR